MFNFNQLKWMGEVLTTLLPKHGVDDCREILLRMGAKEEDIFLSTLNAGHPGGMLPLTTAEAETLHSPLLPDNVYVADATILPQALGLSPMLTIMALAKRIAKLITKMEEKI